MTAVMSFGKFSDFCSRRMSFSAEAKTRNPALVPKRPKSAFPLSKTVFVVTPGPIRNQLPEISITTTKVSINSSPESGRFSSEAEQREVIDSPETPNVQSARTQSGRSEEVSAAALPTSSTVVAVNPAQTDDPVKHKFELVGQESATERQMSAFRRAPSPPSSPTASPTPLAAPRGSVTWGIARPRTPGGDSPANAVTANRRSRSAEKEFNSVFRKDDSEVLIDVTDEEEEGISTVRNQTDVILNNAFKQGQRLNPRVQTVRDRWKKLLTVQKAVHRLTYKKRRKKRWSRLKRAVKGLWATGISCSGCRKGRKKRYKLAFKDKGATGFHSTLKLTDLRTDGHARKCDEDDRDGEADDDDDDDLVIPIGPVPEEATDLPIEQRVKGKSQYASNDRGLKCYKFSESSLQKYWTKVQEQL